MSKGVKRIIGVVAAIAIPFVAPAIAGAMAGSAALAGTKVGAFLGTAGGAAATGAVLGGTAAAATGGNVLTGAALGGLGGYAGAGGFDGMFGGAQPTSTAAVSGPMASSPVPMASPVGLTVPGAAVPGAAVSGAAAVPAAAATAAPTLSNFFQQVGQGILNNPAGTLQLAMTVYGKSPQELTPAEVANLEELKGLASTNQQLFEQRVTEANRLLQQAQQEAPRTEQAFAETKIAAERQLAEQTRGKSAAEAAREKRRTAIRGTQAGATAASAEELRGRTAQTQLTQAGLGALPTSAPQGYAGLALPTYEALQKRRDAFQRDLARSTGDLFGGIA